jgi:hypothetical protein
VRYLEKHRGKKGLVESTPTSCNEVVEVLPSCYRQDELSGLIRNCAEKRGKMNPVNGGIQNPGTSVANSGWNRLTKCEEMAIQKLLEDFKRC